MKKLLIIGASMLQLPAIKKAKEMGLEVAVVDYNPQAIGIACADRYFNASTMDEDAVLKVAKNYQPDGIMTLATDMPMRGVAKASDELGLHSISYKTAVKATDKFDMIKAFKVHNVPSPWFYLVRSFEQLKNLEGDLTYPCIMKPTDNAGSHGVVKVESFEQLLRSYKYSLENSRRGNVIVEEYLEGPEVSVEVMVVDGVVNILQITDKLTTGAPYFVELGHSQPSMLAPEIQNAIKTVATMACKSVGIDKGPAHVEMIVTPKEGPKMVELGARMGGDYITTSLVPLSTGIDMVKATIDVALGNKPDIEAKFHKGSAIRYFQPAFGKIRSFDGIEEAKMIDGVQDVFLTKMVGERSEPIHCSNDRIGSVISQAETAEDAVAICEKALKAITVDIE